MSEIPGRNPTWVWDELVLACDLVVQNGWRGLAENRPEVIELSRLLQTLPLHPLDARLPDFRNPNGVARKSFDIAEGRRLEARMEAFNALNHATFWSGDQFINSTVFGYMASSFYASRLMQFSLEYRF